MKSHDYKWGHLGEFDLYAHAPEDTLARTLRITVKTLRAWRSGSSPVPWWVPELLRLRAWQRDADMRSMGYRRLGIAGSATVYTLPARRHSVAAAPTLSLIDQPEQLRA
ncbi:hypothetical protein [Ralstonia holmesii]|uniref:hypothetical protein n=1 Tax=Ralstonia holmesii TaxID=3058602 RepID=UPI003D65E2DE